MKTIIAGGRDYQITNEDYELLCSLDITEVVSGCCSGADKAGEQFALDNGLDISKYPADWNKYGKSAGPIRNRQMAEYADAVVLFNGGRGTASMHKEAEKAGLVIYDFRVDINRCPVCGYTEKDAVLHADHHLCTNKNPPWKKVFK